MNKREYLELVANEIEEDREADLSTLHAWLKNLEKSCEEAVERYQVENDEIVLPIHVLVEFHGFLYLFREIIADADRSS